MMKAKTRRRTRVLIPKRDRASAKLIAFQLRKSRQAICCNWKTRFQKIVNRQVFHVKKAENIETNILLIPAKGINLAEQGYWFVLIRFFCCVAKKSDTKLLFEDQTMMFR